MGQAAGTPGSADPPVNSGSGRSCVILANGRPPGRATLERTLADRPFLIAADGGADAARALGLVPDLVVGDFDSVTSETRRAFEAKGVAFEHIADQETTDLSKAIRTALGRGFHGLCLLAATGDRTDHVLGALGLLYEYGQTCDLVLRDDVCDIRLVAEGVHALQSPVGTTVSLEAPFGPAEGIWTEGLEYPLRGERLRMGERGGLSNRIISKPASVRVERGALLCFEVFRP